MNTRNWLRVLTSATVWAVVYNLIWGLAWLTFMRREWLAAMAVLHRALPWSVIWAVWLALSIPLGAGSMAYVGNRATADSASSAALAAAFAVWLPLTVGMGVWGWQISLPSRIVALDSLVNLVALVAASLAGGWTQRVAFRWQREQFR